MSTLRESGSTGEQVSCREVEREKSRGGEQENSTLRESRRTGEQENSRGDEEEITSASADILFQPFPFEILPSALSEFCLAQAASICCDPTLVLLPALAAMATAIGNSRRVFLRQMWSEPAILWTACVADSGCGKSPALDVSRRPLDQLQIQARRQFERQTAEYQFWLNAPSNDTAESTGHRSRLTSPLRQDIFLTETNRETIIPALVARPRGLAIVREDLSEWFMRLSDVKRKNIDEEFFLQAYDGRSTQMFRKSGHWQPLGSAVLSISGTIPQAVLKCAAGAVTGGPLGQPPRAPKSLVDPRSRLFALSGVLNNGGVSSEIMARMLFAMPPEQRRQWSDDPVADEVIDRYEQMIFGLAELPTAAGSSSGLPPQGQKVPCNERSKSNCSAAATGGSLGLPPRGQKAPCDERSKPGVGSGHSSVFLELTPRARDRFKEFYNECGEAQCQLEAPWMKAAWSKVEGVAARIALIIACARFVLGETDQEVVDEHDIAAGIAAARWFAREAGRIEAVLAETPEIADQRRLAEWIRMRGGSVNNTELMTHHYRYRSGDAAERALEELVSAGIGTWGPTETTSRGGRPARRFALR